MLNAYGNPIEHYGNLDLEMSCTQENQKGSIKQFVGYSHRFVFPRDWIRKHHSSLSNVLSHELDTHKMIEVTMMISTASRNSNNAAK